jgi:hypothetical protein
LQWAGAAGLITWYVVATNSGHTGVEAMTGGGNVQLETIWIQGATTIQVNINREQAAGDITGASHAVALNQGYAYAWSFNTGTGALNLYFCKAGTCTNEGSAADGGMSPSSNFGGANGDGRWFDGNLYEFAFTKSTNPLALIGPWVQCKYGI